MGNGNFSASFHLTSLILKLIFSRPIDYLVISSSICHVCSLFVLCPRLSVQHNELSDHGLCALAQCLRSNTSLRYLLVWGNHFGPAACEVCTACSGVYRANFSMIFQGYRCHYSTTPVDDVTCIRRWLYMGLGLMCAMTPDPGGC